MAPASGNKARTVRELEWHQERLARANESETRFCVGSAFKSRRHHEVMDADWEVSPVTKQNKDRAWSQLGTSGSGSHFVEFGFFTSQGQIHGLEAGTYLALLSRSDAASVAMDSFHGSPRRRMPSRRVSDA